MADARSLKPLIGRVATGETLSREHTREAFDIMMSGEATPAQIAAFLMALRVRGETVDEITGAATVMRAKMLPLKSPVGAMDVVGTGGDQSGSYNVSTCTAIVVAGAGVPVAKHGNRAMSSKCGSADVLQALGVAIECDAALLRRPLPQQTLTGWQRLGQPVLRLDLVFVPEAVAVCAHRIGSRRPGVAKSVPAP